nr:hypothetical protein [Tanacetum cinerariifolium]
MVSLEDKAILSGADNRPPMLKKDMYDSWKSRMELYMLNRPHGRMILVEVEGVTRLKKYSELSAAEAIQADCDVKATNIILQGLPPEVYALVRPSSLTHSISHPGTDTSSIVNHNTYMASFSAPQIAYAQMDQQSSEYSPPQAELVVPVFQKGDDPIDAINHMMLFLTSVVVLDILQPTISSKHLRTFAIKQQLIMDGSLSNLFKGDRILFRLVRQDLSHQ